MLNYLKQIATGFWSLCVGMKIVFMHSFKKPVTVQYPYETVKLPPRFRGHIELVRDEAGKATCVACMVCQRACPSGCIEVEGEKPEDSNRKVVTKYTLNFTTCSLCGLCVESCSFDALQFSRDYNLASLDKADYQMNLLNPTEKKP